MNGERLAYDLDDLTTLLPFSKDQLYHAITKTGKTTGRLNVAGLSIPIHKQGTRWIVWRSDLEERQPAVVEPEKTQQLRRTSSNTTLPNVAAFRFIK
jgi:Ser/Thr protein kinase RdoA (MazF antagonist)